MRWIAIASERTRVATRPIPAADRASTSVAPRIAELNGGTPALSALRYGSDALALAAAPGNHASGEHRPGSVLVAVSHPDDETLAMGGTLAWLARRGRRVTIVCATGGEAGWIADPLLATRDSLGTVREHELRRAAHVLGVEQ